MSIILLTGCATGNSHQNTKLPYQVIPSTGANYSLPNSTKPSSNLKDSNPSSNYSPAFNYLSPKSDYSSIPPRSTSSSHSNASESPSLPTNIAKPYEYILCQPQIIHPQFQVVIAILCEAIIEKMVLMSEDTRDADNKKTLHFLM